MNIPRDVKPGDPVSAEDHNAVLAALRAMQLGVAPPLQKTSAPSGTFLSLAAIPGARIAKSTGTIGEMSGSTMGSGNIQFYDVSASGALTAGPTITPAVKGWNLASDPTDGPIASGLWLVVVPVVAAGGPIWLVIWCECAE